MRPRVEHELLDRDDAVKLDEVAVPFQESDLDKLSRCVVHDVSPALAWFDQDGLATSEFHRHAEILPPSLVPELRGKARRTYRALGTA